jgi:7-cyano-7-deazaguanine synthase
MKTILIYSGGLDSTVLLYDLLEQGDQVRALSVNYGQRHVRELEAARSLTMSLGVEHRIANLATIKDLLAGSSQTSIDVDVPLGHYTAESMKLTVVPNRNMIMIALAVGWAISKKAHRVAYAAHSGDHAIYPDCRPEFAEAIAEAIGFADWHHVMLYNPYVARSKADLVTLGNKLGVPWDRTWSCYNGAARHCGKCGTCVERKEAFELAKVDDPTLYEPD